MSSPLPLHEMSLADKLQAMEDIWADLSQRDSGYEPPAWHETILQERQQKRDSGEMRISDWETAKREIRQQTR